MLIANNGIITITGNNKEKGVMKGLLNASEVAAEGARGRMPCGGC
jgi:hypothetical protein